MNSDHTLAEIVRLTSILSVVIPLILYVVKMRHASRPVHFVGVLIIISALSDIAAYFLSARGESTVTLFNSYYVIVFILLGWFYYEILPPEKSSRTTIAGLVVYVLAFILVTLYVQPFNVYQTFMWTITGMIMIFFSISYFINLFSARINVSSYELLWINSGILLYFSLNLFLFVMSSYILTKLDPEISVLIWSFHNVNNIMKNVLFGCGIYAFSKERVVSSETAPRTSRSI